MKKILLVALDINPLVGSECGVANIWLRIISRHYHVHVVTPLYHKKGISTEQYDNVDFHYIDILSGVIPRIIFRLRLFNVINSIFIRKSKPVISRLISREKFELMHVITPAGIHSCNDLYKFKLPLVIGPLGGGLKLPKGFDRIFSRKVSLSRLRDVYYSLLRFYPGWKKYFLKADRIIVGTPYLLDILPKGIKDKTEIIFDTTVDPDIYKNYHQNTPGLSVFFAGRMEPHKGCGLLFEAFSHLSKEYPELRLEFAGEGSLLKSLKKKARKMGLDDRIVFHGEVDRYAVVELMNRSHIFCLPTLREPGGVSILEAMSCELPVVTSDYGGPAYSVTDSTGIKIKPVDYESYLDGLTESLKFLIENRETRKKMGRQGRKRVLEEYSPQALEQKILNVYQKTYR